MSGPQPQPGGDPVQGALAYGRRKAGLPVDFEQGHTTPSFDDGGVVPDPSAAPPQPQATDPQQLLKYLSGDGALSPDVVMAMEAMADPDSSMDATSRMAAVLGKAPSPDVAFGVLQHHRTKYNGHTAAARVAADKGDYAKAAMHANKAHESVPGSRKRFAPVPGGVQMMNGYAPQQDPQEEAYGDGGTVDSGNPNEDDGYTDDTGSENSYYDGGVVGAGESDERYENMPESINVEDRRGEKGEGWAPKDSWAKSHDGPNPDKGGLGNSDLANYDSWRAGAAISRKQKSYADGGEVEEDPDVTAAVTPDESGGGDNTDEGAAVSHETGDDDLTTGSFQQLNTPRPQISRGDSSADGEARMLSPEDLSRSMSLGYDAAVAAANKAKEADTALSGTSYGKRIWDLMPSNGRTYKAPQGSPQGFGDTQQGEDDGTFPDQGPMPADGGPAAPAAGGATPDQGPADPDAGYKKDRQHANERRDEMLQWYEGQSRKLFPWASQEHQRQAFIMHGMERFFGQDLSRENNIRADKAGIAERGIQATGQRDAEKNRIREESNIRNNETRKQVAAFNQTQQGQRFQQGQIASTLRAGIMSGTVDISDPKAVAPLVKAFEQATGHKVDPSDHDTIKEILGLNRSIVKPQGQSNGSPPPDAPMGQLWTDPNGVLRVKSEKGWGKA